MTNILHVVLNLNVGGLERFIIELIKNYSNNISPFVVCLEDAGELAKFVKGATVIVLNKKPGLKFNVIRKLVDIIKTHNIQIIHTHNEAAHFYGSFSGYLCKVPIIHTRHGRYLHNSRKKILLNMVSSFLSTKIVGVSQDVSDLIAKNESISKNKVMTIVNGVDVKVYSSQPVKNLFIDNDKMAGGIKIGIVARLNVVKDHLNLFKACNILRKHNNDFMLIVVGDGPLRPQLESEVCNLQLQNNVLFTGTRNDIADILNEIDIYVLSSTSEGTSMTLLEAMSCGLPVVATNVGGSPEVVIDGQTGYLVPPKNPEILAEKLLTLIKDVNLRTYMGRAGRERVLQHYSISKTAEKYEQLYNQIKKEDA